MRLPGVGQKAFAAKEETVSRGSLRSISLRSFVLLSAIENHGKRFHTLLQRPDWLE